MSYKQVLATGALVCLSLNVVADDAETVTAATDAVISTAGAPPDWVETRRAMMEQMYQRMLSKAEERMASAEAAHAERAKQAEDRRRFLEEHHQEMLQQALDTHTERSEHHQLRMQLMSERRDQLVAQREAFEAMTPEQRNEVLSEKMKEARAQRPQPAPPQYGYAPRRYPMPDPGFAPPWGWRRY
ncbi:MAG TPA: hypothetical protein EYN01_03165 [Chromatiales bacterium]|jgi:signal recognition particle GTPase|nr:hypothetical protein [Chromatiales bacterium]